MLESLIDRRRWLKSGTAVLAASAIPFVYGSATCAADDNAEGDWTTWRGPTGDNHAAAGSQGPTQYSAKNISWAAPVPGRGHSSPIVAGDLIYLTTADKEAGTQGVLAYQRKTGRPAWTQVVHRGGIPAENHAKNTEASPSVAFDGERVIAAFYNSSAIWLSALSPDGKPLWQQSIGAYEPRAYKYGYAASPTLYQDHVIVVGDYDGKSFLAAHDRSTGKPLWKVARRSVTSFSSPIIANLCGRDQLLISGGEAIDSYDPASGKSLWSAPALAMATCGTLVWDGEYVFGSGGYPKPETACVKADGSGEVVWTNNQKCYEQSMLAVNGFIYAVTDAGVAHCWRASDGETMWRERLGGDYSSSPVLSGENIHVFNEQGQGFVFKATEKEYVAAGGGKFGDECFATPAIIGKTMYMRIARNQNGKRQEYLVALG